MRQDGPYFLGQNGVDFGVIESRQFIYQSFLCINNSPDWVYFMAAAEGSTTVDPYRYSVFAPPFTMGTVPAGGFSLAWLRSSTPAFDVSVVNTQPTGAERVTIVLFDQIQSAPFVTLPGVTLATVPVSGDLNVDTIWWHEAAAGGRTGPDDSVKLLLSPNGPEETGLRIVGYTAQAFNLLEVLDSTFATLFNVTNGGSIVTAQDATIGDDLIVLGNVEGTVRFVPVATQRLQIDDTTRGGAWDNWTPSYTNFTVGNGTLDWALYAKIGRMVHAKWRFTMGATSAWPGGALTVSLPVTGAGMGSADVVVGVATYRDSSVPTYYYGTCKASNTGVQIGNQLDAGSGLNWGSTSPVAIGAGDAISFNITYESAA